VYRKDINIGGWFSFNATKQDWKDHYAEKMLNHFFDKQGISNSFRGVSIDEELLLTENLNFSNLENKKVLVIGGGPSTQKLNNKVLDNYDYLFSCNHFYRNSFLRNKQVNLVLVGDEVDLNDSEFIAYIKEFSPVLGFEHSSRRSTHDIIKFKRKYPKTFVYLTRYFSRLGYVARACVLAKQMKARQIDFVGLDGFRNNRHAFERVKNAPSFNNEDSFKEQMKVFCQYMLEGLSSERFNNLSENSDDSIYKGILTEIKNEKN